MSNKTKEIFEELISLLNTEEEFEHFNKSLLLILNSLKKTYNKNYLIETFITNFLNTTNIYYNKTSEVYFKHDENNISVMNDNQIMFYIFDTISNSKKLKASYDMKNKIKNKIIKKIKQNSIYDIIPDTEIIQYIVNWLTPTIFQNKDISKCFLIIIGNIIMKKNNQDINIFVPNNLKQILDNINKYISIYFHNISVYNQFKFKYTSSHENKENYIIPSNDINNDVLNLNEQFFINLICVSIYYSNRYKTIHNYIKDNTCNEQTINTILYFEKFTKDNTIKTFTKNYLVKKKNQSIRENELIFLWKKYLHDNNMFVNVFYSQGVFIQYLFNSLNQEYNDNKSQNELKGFLSLETPNIEYFKQFWNNNFEYDENESYFELNEILYLFNNTKKNKNINIDEIKLKMIIQSHYPTFKIINNKIINNLKCNLWDKKKEINDFLSSFFNNEESVKNMKKSMNQLYKDYCNYSTNKNIKVSKKYFINYLDKE